MRGKQWHSLSHQIQPLSKKWLIYPKIVVGMTFADLVVMKTGQLWVCTILVLGMALGACADEEPDGLASGASPNGSSGQSGMGGVPSPVLLGEYDLKPTKSVGSGYATGHASAPPVHLSLSQVGSELIATLSTPFETLEQGKVTFDPTVLFGDENGDIKGPLMIETNVSLGNNALRTIALDLDSDGRPTKAQAVGFTTVPGLNCVQSATGDSFRGTYDVNVDQSAPNIKGTQTALPWEAKLALSEAMTFSNPSVTGAKLKTLTSTGLMLQPTFEGGHFALLSKTVTFDFGTITDAVGNTSEASVDLSFLNPDLITTTTNFSANGECSGLLFGNENRVVTRVAKPGIKKLSMTLCGKANQNNFGNNVTLNAWSDDGTKTMLSDYVPVGQKTVIFDLPADDVVIVLSGEGCGGVSLDLLELL
jgi:hypothetical protein